MLFFPMPRCVSGSTDTDALDGELKMLPHHNYEMASKLLSCFLQWRGIALR